MTDAKERSRLHARIDERLARLEAAERGDPIPLLFQQVDENAVTTGDIVNVTIHGPSPRWTWSASRGGAAELLVFSGTTHTVASGTTETHDDMTMQPSADLTIQPNATLTLAQSTAEAAPSGWNVSLLGPETLPP